MSNRYRAFICYSQQNNREAARLHRRIESFRVPKRLRGVVGRRGTVPEALAPVFRDREELHASADIGERLRNALARSDFLIVLCSPAAARSRWVNAEIETFCALEPGNRERVLAVLVGGEPASGDPATECFPSALLASGSSDGALSARYPLAADFRANKDRRLDAELRLFAALLGVEFDILKQREQERRIGRLRFALALTVAVVGGFAALAAFAVWRGEQAREAEERAAQAARRAASARAEAEKLVDFMLKDLRASLEVLGKLDLLEPANEKVRAYYATVTLEEQDLPMLRRQGSAFHAYAVDLRNHLRGAKTLAVLETATLFRRRVVELVKKDAGAWLDLAETYRMIAIQCRDDGNIVRSLEEFAKARQFALRGLSLAPANLKAAARVASLATDEAEALMRVGRSGEALSLLCDGLRELERLISLEPGTPEWKHRASAAAWQLGNLHRRAGDYVAAEANYRRGLQWAEELCTAEPRNVLCLRRRQVAAAGFGQMLLEAERFDAAVDLLRRKLGQDQEVLALDPTNPVYQDALANTLANLAEAERASDRDAAAREHIRECVQRRESILAAGATDVHAKSALAYALATLSEIESKASHHETAVEMARRSVDLADELCRENATDARLADDFAYFRSKLARALRVGERLPEAEREYRSALAQMDAVIAREPDAPQLTRWRDRATWQLRLAAILEQTGRVAEARELLTACIATFDRVGREGLSSAISRKNQQEAATLLAQLASGR